MRTRFVVAALACLPLLAAAPRAPAGDSLDGTISEAREPTLVMLEVGRTRFRVRLIGVRVPPDPISVATARAFLRDSVVGRSAHARIEYENDRGELVSRVFVPDTTREGAPFTRDVSRVMVAAGVAQADDSDGDPFGLLTLAEDSAKTLRRGFWSRRYRR